MEPLKSVNDLLSFMQSQPFDKKLPAYHMSLYPDNKLPYNNGYGLYYNYILDWQTGTYVYLSRGFEELTGHYDIFFERGIKAGMELQHPNDVPALLKMVSKWIELLWGKNEEKFNQYSSNFNFRFKTRSGAWLNLLQQPVYCTMDRYDNLVYEAGIFINITRFRSDGNISLVIYGPDGRMILEYYPKEEEIPRIAPVRNFIAEFDLIAGQSGNRFIRKVQKLLTEHYTDNGLTVEVLSERLCISRSQLYRQLEKTVGIPPHRLIHLYRLQQSLEYLAQNDLTVSEVALRVGFRSPAWFTQCFCEEFECTPSDYRQLVL
jgi:AraC-like DNA-binding protein